MKRREDELEKKKRIAAMQKEMSERIRSGLKKKRESRK